MAVRSKLGSGDHLYLVDGSGYIFRAYHALPPLTRKSDGLPVGAVSGFCNMLAKLLDEMDGAETPTHLGVIFDASGRSFRNEIYSDYKAHRPPAPEDLVPQFPLVRDAVRAFNIPAVEKEGFEADDLIATYAEEAAKAGARVTIVSSDKDLMQLVGGTIDMVDTMKDKKIDLDGVIEKFGVGPERVIDVQALAGDSVGQCTGCARHWHQNGGTANRRIWRSGHSAGARRRDQTTKAAGKPGKFCRAGAYQPRTCNLAPRCAHAGCA